MERKTSMLESIILFALISVTIVIFVQLKLGLQIPLLFSWIILYFFCLIKGIDYNALEKHALDAIRSAFVVVLILLSVGTLIGSWIISGTVPTIICHGLDLINPRYFLPVTVIICSIMSLATGTSYGSAGSGGLAMMGIGIAMGFPPGMIAGAVICGALFGDKLSPFSDSTNLASGMANADLFKHIRSCLWTTVPPYILTLIFFTFLGFRHVGSGVFDEATLDSYRATLNGIFKIGWVSLLPLILVVVLLIRKVAAFISILMGALFGVFVAYFYQGRGFSEIMKTLYEGFTISSGVEFVDKLLNRGGMMSMFDLMIVIVFAIGLGSMLEYLGVLGNILDRITKRIHSTGSLILATLGIGYVTTAIGCNMAMGQVITGRLMSPIFKQRGVAPEVLSRTLSDAGVLGGTMMPWHTTSIFFATTLGVGYLDYIPYVPLCYLTPFVALVMAYMGIAVGTVPPEDPEPEASAS